MEVNRMFVYGAALALAGAAFGDAIGEALTERPGLVREEAGKRTGARHAE